MPVLCSGKSRENTSQKKESFCFEAVCMLLFVCFLKKVRFRDLRSLHANIESVSHDKAVQACSTGFLM